MKRKLLCLFAVMALLLATTSLASADNSILQSLKTQGVALNEMDDATLSTVRGAALTVLQGQPHPSTIAGLRTHHVTWKKFGSTADYRSYNYVGGGFTPDNPNKHFSFTYNNGNYRVGGDQWWADTKSDPNSWNKANANVIEYHYQVLDWNTGNPSAFAFHDTAWNRPLTTFRW